MWEAEADNVQAIATLVEVSPPASNVPIHCTLATPGIADAHTQALDTSLGITPTVRPRPERCQRPCDRPTRLSPHPLSRLAPPHQISAFAVSAQSVACQVTQGFHLS